ncbi:MAG: hypothetical protein B6U97_03210 [Candidatus Altiarchaeales archaeon ex4484_96]|nr:MAG: hypothetical protein B6U97_03210 [Candidatus Altiarchaeales archaeon ex4484_96]
MKPRIRELCLHCKGSRLLCGEKTCPLLAKAQIKQSTELRLSEYMYGKSPSVFIGHHFYPNVYIGPMTALDGGAAELLDDPARWYGSSLAEIINMRSKLLRSKKKQNIHTNNSFTQEIQELALASKPVYVENTFKKKPSFAVSFSNINQPMGPSGELIKLSLTENPRIPAKVDAVVSDELSARQATTKLYLKQYDVYYLTRILSSGALGLEDKRRLVPTRWSITAVDDIISKELMSQIRDYPSINEYLIHENTYLDNHFMILFMPGRWEFEQFEAWAPKTLWTQSATTPVITQENEPYAGRTRYAHKQGGGYYAARFAVTEYLHRIKRQARSVVFREISEGYVVPVGVWEVRENTRRALKKKPSKHDTLPKALHHLKTKLKLPLKDYLTQSEVLRQKKMIEYI